MNLILRNGTVFDGLSPEMRDGQDVRIEDGKIVELSDRELKSQCAQVLNLGGKTIMPGLIDAHYHAYGCSLNVAVIDRTAPALRALWARKNLEASLQRGFTTVRDAAGGDLSLALGIEHGLIIGPRFFFSGLAISQTGGHGDLRAPDHEAMCPCLYRGALSVVADGADAVRRAVREQLRRGVTQIKICASGGALSPSDPLWMNQLTDDEIRVAVEEARTRKTYVMAHAHTPEAAIRCVRNGVRSVEHATITTAESAAEIKRNEAYVVPTLSITNAAQLEGKGLGLTSTMLGKLKELDSYQLASIERLQEHKVDLGFGTDLLGFLMDSQSGEFALRQQVQSAYDVLRSATAVNASILDMEGQLGVVAIGACADLLVLDGNPLRDITVLTKPEKILMVIRSGSIVRNLLKQ
jgi:imidazolonepropionase-like amidohydrolase